MQAAACNQAKTHGIPCAESRSALPARLLPSLGSGGKPGASWGSLRLCPCAGIRRLQTGVSHVLPGLPVSGRGVRPDVGETLPTTVFTLFAVIKCTHNVPP